MRKQLSAFLDHHISVHLDTNENVPHQKVKKKLLGCDSKRIMIFFTILKGTITIAGLIRNFAPAFMAFLASIAFKTVPTCKIL